MNIMLKVGSKVTIKGGFSRDQVKEYMEVVLQEHPHLCATCKATSCINKRSFDSDIVVRGVRTLNRDYIFDCLCYIPKKEIATVSSDVDSEVVSHRYTDNDYSVVHPKIKQIFYRMK